MYVDLVYLALYEGFSQETNLTHMQESVKEKEKESKLLTLFSKNIWAIFSNNGLAYYRNENVIQNEHVPNQAKKNQEIHSKKSFVHCPIFYLKKQKEQGTTTVDEKNQMKPLLKGNQGPWRL